MRDSLATSSTNVFTVSPGRPFLRALAEAILSGNLPRNGGAPPDPLELAAWTILMPTRRAARTLQEAFLDASGGATAMLLPAIRPIAEGQDDVSLIEAAVASVCSGEAVLSIKPAIGALERTLLLTELVLFWSRAVRTGEPANGAKDAGSFAPVPGAGATSPAQAARLAVELARLIDAVETENVSLASLATLVPDEYSAHWQQTLDFLRIVTDFWPAHLAEQGLISSADRRNRLIAAEAARLLAAPPSHPVIIAGVTGSVPATAELMRAVAGLANGAIVLPGLDMHLEADTFDRLATEHPEHPQHGLTRVLEQLGVARSDVVELPGTALPARRDARNVIVSEAMRPTGSMAGWRKLQAVADTDAMRRALAGVHLIEAPTAEDEAEAVSLILREALETPGRTAALVSPDRLLARRVATRLEGWGIRVDDSAGRPFAKTVPGAFLDLVANALDASFAPQELMALLKHPLTRLGLSSGDVRRAARNLELAALRTTYLGRGLKSLAEAVERVQAETAGGARRHRSVTRINAAGWAQLHDLVRRLHDAFGPLIELVGSERHPLSRIVAAHVAVAEAIAKPVVEDDAEDGASSPLWDRDEGAAASLLLARLMNGDMTQPSLPLADYPDFFRALVGSESIRTRVPRHPRLSIWGPYEARLQQPDVVVLGSLNDGVWPKVSDPGPWLNRGMRATLGLPSPEEETGRAAHDIVTLLGAETVYLTRANKVSGVPMVPSRWLLRLNALLAGLQIQDALAPPADTPWLAWARARDMPADVPRISQPAPTPPLAKRPRRASVSDVETWLANPYAIYAKRILGLEALPPLGQEPGPSERGQIVHEALARFTKRYPDELPPDIVGAFMEIADEVIGTLGSEPRVRAFWRPRLARFAHWFGETEAGRRSPGSHRLVEIDGKLPFEAPGGTFTLTARADRIDLDRNGIVITDYKTGRVPQRKAVEAGEAPQLPLEAAMAGAGVFPHVPGGVVTGLRYIRATGAEPPGEEGMIAPKERSITELAADALRQLQTLVAQYDDEATPYKALRRKRFDYTYDDYAHLARIEEWAGDDEGGGEA